MTRSCHSISCLAISAIIDMAARPLPTAPHVTPANALNALASKCFSAPVPGRRGEDGGLGSVPARWKACFGGSASSRTFGYEAYHSALLACSASKLSAAIVASEHASSTCAPRAQKEIKEKKC